MRDKIFKMMSTTTTVSSNTRGFPSPSYTIHSSLPSPTLSSFALRCGDRVCTGSSPPCVTRGELTRTTVDWTNASSCVGVAPAITRTGCSRFQRRRPSTIPTPPPPAPSMPSPFSRSSSLLAAHCPPSYPSSYLGPSPSPSPPPPPPKLFSLPPPVLDVSSTFDDSDIPPPPPPPPTSSPKRYRPAFRFARMPRPTPSSPPPMEIPPELDYLISENVVAQRMKEMGTSIRERMLMIRPPLSPRPQPLRPPVNPPRPRSPPAAPPSPPPSCPPSPHVVAPQPISRRDPPPNFPRRWLRRYRAVTTTSDQPIEKPAKVPYRRPPSPKRPPMSEEKYPGETDNDFFARMREIQRRSAIMTRRKVARRFGGPMPSLPSAPSTPLQPSPPATPTPPPTYSDADESFYTASASFSPPSPPSSFVWVDRQPSPAPTPEPVPISLPPSPSPPPPATTLLTRVKGLVATSFAWLRSWFV